MTGPRQSVLVLTLATADVANANHRGHWRTQWRKTRFIREYAATVAGMNRPDKLAAADLVVEIGWPDKRRRDAHNVMPTLKAAIDGFVQDYQLLPDDSDSFLTGPDLRTHVTGKTGTFTFTFTFTEREPQ